MEFKTILEILILFVMGLYYVTMIKFYKGWKTIIIPSSINKQSTTFSFVIPFRNEQENLPALLNSFLKLDYPLDKFQLIFVDDQSDDDSYQVVADFIEISSFDALLLESIGGKKKAIVKALGSVKMDIVVFLDSDVSFGPDLLNTYELEFENEKIALVAGPVQFVGSQDAFQKFCELEFISLVVSGAGAIATGRPIMMNGANYAVRKMAIDQISGDSMRQNIASGDDVFVLQSVKNFFGTEAIKFSKSRGSIVSTRGPENIIGFLQQRIRWTSKAKFYDDYHLTRVSILVFITNLLLTFYPAYMMANFSCRKLTFFLAIMGVKVLIDWRILNSGIDFFDKKYLNRMVVPSSFVYPVYVVVVGILGQVLPVSWKGRIVDSTGRLKEPQQ